MGMRTQSKIRVLNENIYLERLSQWLSGKESAHSAGDLGDGGLICGSGAGNGSLLRYCCLRNSMDRGA